MSTSASYDQALQGNQKFRSEIYPQKQELFATLANGQSPHITFLTCADSRIDPCLITQTEPGDLFVIRNAGNMVPSSTTAGGEIASIEFSVKALGTDHIVVCGHSGCGAMKGLMNPDSCASLQFVGPWVQEAQAALSGGTDLASVTKANVALQLENLKKLDFIKEAQENGKLQLHGWVYDIGSGEIEVIA